MTMISVAEAANLVLAQAVGFGIETIPFLSAAGRRLACDIVADRDLPPYDRVTMDGIAIRGAAFTAGKRSFVVRATIAAGDTPVQIDSDGDCIELMTGCALPAGTDTVVRYEDIEIDGGIATIVANTIKPGANVHRRGTDKHAGETVVPVNTLVDAAVISMAASVGQADLQVWKLPRVAIVSTGNELVDVQDTPGPYQIRRSNSYAIHTVLQQLSIAADMVHIPDEPSESTQRLGSLLSQYDAIILSGGVSMGRFDYVPQALTALGVQMLFHKVSQRPGKPFWFGVYPVGGKAVFAFPGNPVSAFLCLYRYFIPWLKAGTGHADTRIPVAVLAADYIFQPPLTYFLQVHLSVSEAGQLFATPVEGHGSGDFSNLVLANAFMELPAEITNFKKGDIYPVWPFKPVF